MTIAFPYYVDGRFHSPRWPYAINDNAYGADNLVLAVYPAVCEGFCRNFAPRTIDDFEPTEWSTVAGGASTNFALDQMDGMSLPVPRKTAFSHDYIRLKAKADDGLWSLEHVGNNGDATRAYAWAGYYRTYNDSDSNWNVMGASIDESTGDRNWEFVHDARSGLNRGTLRLENFTIFNYSTNTTFENKHLSYCHAAERKNYFNYTMPAPGDCNSDSLGVSTSYGPENGGQDVICLNGQPRAGTVYDGMAQIGVLLVWDRFMCRGEVQHWSDLRNQLGLLEEYNRTSYFLSIAGAAAGGNVRPPFHHHRFHNRAA